MLYQKTSNVQGFQGWIDAVIAHPNTNLSFQKSHEYSTSQYDYRYDRVEFIVGGKYVAYERQLRKPINRPDLDYEQYENATYLVGNVSNKSFDPDTMADPDRMLSSQDEVSQQTPGNVSVLYNTGIVVPILNPLAGDEIGLIDDNFIMYAVHVFADINNLYIVFEPEAGTFLHMQATTDVTTYETTGYIMVAGGCYVINNNNDSIRSREAIGWQYNTARNSPYILNEGIPCFVRDASPTYTYGWRLDDLPTGTPDRKVWGGAPPATSQNGELYPASWQYLPPGSDLVHYGAFSIYGRSLTTPIRWWYLEGPTNQTRPIFELNNVRTVHMRGVRPLDEFVIDGQTWVAFPDFKLPNSYGGLQSTIFANTVDEDIATPMGVLIRKD